MSTGNCMDVVDQPTCEKWKGNGDCIVNEKWMKLYCRDTCGLCSNDATPPGSEYIYSYTSKQCQ